VGGDAVIRLSLAQQHHWTRWPDVLRTPRACPDCSGVGTVLDHGTGLMRFCDCQARRPEQFHPAFRAISLVEQPTEPEPEPEADGEE
jgi:hypothetical protein